MVAEVPMRKFSHFKEIPSGIRPDCRIRQPMDLQSPYRKTPKGEQEIATRANGLSARVRSVLIMVDGRISGADLLKRAGVLGEGGALVGTLIDGGFIEPVAGAADTPAASASGRDQFGPAHLETILFASRFLVEALGPAFDELGGRIEACRDSAKLMHLLEGVRDVIGSNAGRKKAEAFWTGVMARLPAS